MYSRLNPEICGNKILPPVFLTMTFLLSPTFRDVSWLLELRFFLIIIIFNVSKPPLFPMCLRELERGKKP